MKKTYQDGIREYVEIFRKLDKLVADIEGYALVFIFFVMLLIGVGQIAARQIFHSGAMWVEPFLKNMVPWIGLIGASIASREGRHISVDALSRLLPPIGKWVVRLLIALLMIFVCFLFYKSSVDYMKVLAQGQFAEKIFAINALHFTGIEVWKFQYIFPVSFVFIAFHYFLKLLIDILGLFIGEFELIKRADEADDDMPANTPDSDNMEGKIA